MNTREQFGKYLLLKKLTEDPLGETFRAGLLGSIGMERVSLLRVFNGQGLDGPRLWDASKERQAIQGVLRSPNIGEGIEIGEIQGIPYAAYEYVSGKNMATLLEQAAKKRNYVPTEHALLITERVALALAAASENRLGGQRILHGFLVPQLTMISNEGETRLLGFEMAPGLRGFAANPVIRQHFGRYLSPETLDGAAPDRSDDIYSIGVFLFELLTGRPLPPPGPDGYASVIDQGVLAAEQEPIPEELRQLLRKTLVAREQRMSDVVAWHKALNSWMFEGQYNPTTFNLAFFMHNLFRQEIERENQEIEVEKTLPVPIQKPTPAAAAATPAAVATSAPVAAASVPPSTPVESEKTENFIPEYVRDEPKSKTGLYAALALALLGVVAAAAYFMMPGGSTQGVDNAQNLTSLAPTPVAAAPPTEPVAQGLTEKEVKEQVLQIIAIQRSEFEEEQKKKYDKKLADLQKKLDETNERRHRQDLERQKQELERQRQEEADREEKAAAERAAELQRQAEIKKAEDEKAAAAAAAAAAEEATRLAEQEPSPPVEPPPPAAPQVRRGDLVDLVPGVNPPVRVRVNARFPEMARRLRKTGAEVTVKALINENGKVLETELVGKKVGFGFDTEAEQAVKRGTFKPATVDGVAVKVWFNVNVKFQQQ